MYILSTVVVTNKVDVGGSPLSEELLLAFSGLTQFAKDFFSFSFLGGSGGGGERRKKAEMVDENCFVSHLSLFSFLLLFDDMGFCTNIRTRWVVVQYTYVVQYMVSP